MSRTRLISTSVLLFAACALQSPTFGQSCAFWTFDTGYPGPGATVRALAGFHDRTGPALYVGGDFNAMAGVPTSNIARWNGTSWSQVGGGTDNWVLALQVFDDGTGPALYVGGAFLTAGGAPALHIAKWDGNAWSQVGGTTRLGVVHALAVFDDGGGPALYAATTNRVLKWDGLQWLNVGRTSDGPILALAVADLGAGPALYAGGDFTRIGGIAANSVIRWDGVTWSALGSGINRQGENDTVHALAAFDDGNGAALYAGGNFLAAGGVSANRIARWDGAHWSALGTGIAGQDAEVYALSVFGFRSQAWLHVGGRSFGNAGGEPADHIAAWDGRRWWAVGQVPAPFGPNASVEAMTTFGAFCGPGLYVAGQYSRASRLPDAALATWLILWGDLDCDGEVDLSELGILLADFGCTGGNCIGDVDGDGDTDLADLGLMLIGFECGN